MHCSHQMRSEVHQVGVRCALCQLDKLDLAVRREYFVVWIDTEQVLVANSESS